MTIGSGLKLHSEWTPTSGPLRRYRLRRPSAVSSAEFRKLLGIDWLSRDSLVHWFRKRREARNTRWIGFINKSLKTVPWFPMTSNKAPFMKRNESRFSKTFSNVKFGPKTTSCADDIRGDLAECS